MLDRQIGGRKDCKQRKAPDQKRILASRDIGKGEGPTKAAADQSNSIDSTNAKTPTTTETEADAKSTTEDKDKGSRPAFEKKTSGLGPRGE